MDAFLGEIRLFAGNFNPKYWAYCHGQALSIDDNQALFSLIGTTYGGDGRISFKLPDLRGRLVMGSGATPGGIFKRRGSYAGNDYTVLNMSNLPPHAHPISAASVTHNLCAVGDAEVKCQATHGNTTSPEGKTFAAANDRGGDTIYGDDNDQLMKVGTVLIDMEVTGDINVSGSTSSVGSGKEFSNLPPFGVVDYIICVKGLYPSRS